LHYRSSFGEEYGGAIARLGVGWHRDHAALEQLFEMMSDLVVVTRPDGGIVLVNRAWEETLGWSEHELVGRSIFELVHPDDEPSTRAIAVGGEDVANYSNRFRHKDGSWRWLLWSGRSDGEVWCATAKDVTERLLLERRALCDELTGLANRALLLDHLRSALARLDRSEHKLVAVLSLDLDGFKLVNDGHGREAGDQTLAEVARRVREVVRETDVVSRLGGDEFVIVAEGLSRDTEALLLAERVVEAVGRDLALSAVPYTLSCSVGIATTPHSASDADVLLREADTAMYRAKTRGAGHIERFDGSLTAEVTDRFKIAQELRKALLCDELTVCYQPVVSVEGGEMISCEALVRWNHPEQGWMLPDRFVPFAETTGLIVQLGQRVLEDACRQAAEWRAFGRELTVSVNVSRRQLLEPGFVEIVRGAIGDSGLPPEAITLEVTETAAPARHAGIAEVLQDVRSLGVKIALDDFGSGYWTLANLRELPIDVIKIDSGFIAGIASGPNDRRIVAAVLALAGELGLAVVAEGVETPEQLAVLRDLGCPFAQGYLFARPVAPEQLFQLSLHSGQERASATGA
jgi:diguanylate cyclase (GGDEF)-like protein/PAS domain S-box-containing protein